VTGPLVSILLNNFGSRLLKETFEMQQPENTFEEIVRMHREYYDRENFNSDEQQVFEPTQEYRAYLENRMKPGGGSKNDQGSIE
jgi:hypothetical protein